MSKQMACGRVVPDCTWEAMAESEEELLAKVAEHAKESHGIDAPTPELVEQVKEAIRDVP